MIKSTLEPKKNLSLTSNPVKDFWLLGGLSILVWLVLIILDPIKSRSELVTSQFLKLAAFFSVMSFLCNYPHFLVSYRFAYTRGSKFILRHSLSLIIVPVFLIALYIIGYYYFSANISTNPLILFLNTCLLKSGLTYQVGNATNLGTEILSFTVRIMYATVGWHYSKQIFGCMMVYGNYSAYSFTKFQKNILKFSLFSIAFYNFFFMSILPAGGTESNYFFNIPIVTLGFSAWLIPFFEASVIISFLSVCYFIFYKKYAATKKMIPINILVPYIAFHIWWIPPIRQNEFYFLMIPFFHSLQYLPFAYRLEVKRGEHSNQEKSYLSLKILFLLMAGALAFEIIPNFLDIESNSYSHLNTWYFMISFAVFINIHHFFIDSTIWKFSDHEIRDRILT